MSGTGNAGKCSERHLVTLQELGSSYVMTRQSTLHALLRQLLRLSLLILDVLLAIMFNDVVQFPQLTGLNVPRSMRVKRSEPT